ncbi:hypothetical protein AaE_002835 [Aphanomyces astaci]|uniref:Uncharacterized protein n=1 Tax=Aphanomyces astaci TaxID=112090 RepID=A0A6A5AS62_APHAT|nr:hypothetical protein AaE_003225 [Aphanomyces astaci]KAF0767759.1 hypothetical protein AaE_002835 [Aphanomyces astaci]
MFSSLLLPVLAFAALATAATTSPESRPSSVSVADRTVKDAQEWLTVYRPIIYRPIIYRPVFNAPPAVALPPVMRPRYGNVVVDHPVVRVAAVGEGAKAAEQGAKAQSN